MLPQTKYIGYTIVRYASRMIYTYLSMVTKSTLIWDLPGLYYIEYTLQNPGESRRHIYSAIGMANNGWYNRLYTVTGQVNLALLV